MKRKLLSLILALSIVSQTAWASKAAVGGNTIFSVLTAGVTRYALFTSQEAWQTTNAAAEVLIPWDSTVSNLTIEGADPGAGNSITYTVQRNGSDTATSLISCQGTNANGGDCTDSDSDDFTAGDSMSLKAVVSASLGGGFYVAKLSASVDYGAGKSAFLGGDNTASTATTSYFNPNGNTSSTTESSRTSPVGIGFTATRIYVKIDTDPANGASVQSWTYTLMKNGSPSDLACTISEGATTCNSTAGTTTWSAGDTISLRRESANTPTAYTNSAWGIGITTTEGYTPVQVTSNSSSHATNVEGAGHSGHDNGYTTVDFYTKYYSAPHNFDIKNLYVTTTVAPSSGKSYTIDIDTSYGGGSAVDCTVSDANTSCNSASDTDSITALGEGPSILSTPSGTPTIGRYHFGFTQFAYGTGEPSASTGQVIITD